MKILIIDDNPDELLIAKSRLKKECGDIFCAEGGATGLEIAKREMPDLILLDVDMPDMSGFDVCRALKADPELCMIPVLFLSGFVSPEDKIRGLDLGGVDYIAKPFDAFELQARVRAALRMKNLQDMLIKHAHIDPLTGLPNRRALMERLQQEWTRMQRHGRPCSLIMADIDQFKKVNDTYGHLVGDQLLLEVANVIAKQCRNIDMPARYGGEEFAIVVSQETAAKARFLAERCRSNIEMLNILVHGDAVHVTVSFGIADAEGLTSSQTLIEHADEALYAAKIAGRNKIVAYDEIEKAIKV
ncbi:MAG: diguanylate cyclase [Thermoguttaceae bacterium]|jgi:diguanylate cyclase (GGDEF)-like protein